VAARDLAHRIKTLIGISAEIEVMAPQTLERVLVGKAVRVFDRRGD
jgi:phenylacetate-CoA ligase